KGQIAVDAFLLKQLGGSNTFPGAGDLDEDTVARDALFLIQRDELAAFGDGPGGIETQAGSDFGRDASGNHLENLTSEKHEKPINEFSCHFFVAAAALERKAGGLFHQMVVDRHLSRMKKK